MTVEEALDILRYWASVGLDERSTDIKGNTAELREAYEVICERLQLVAGVDVPHIA